MPDFLAKIIASTREDLIRRKQDRTQAQLKQSAQKRQPGRLARAVAGPGVSVIAEIKRASPSKGDIRPDLDPAEIAAAYEQAGARAISVLTEENYFQGSLDDLRQARSASSLPILRKDFIIDPYQVWEAADAGADAILLIVAALEQKNLEELMAEAAEAGLDQLVEVHKPVELTRALKAGATIVGINNRDLGTFEVSLRTTMDMIESVPNNILVVSESGISSRADVTRLEGAGVDAILVGETLMKSPDPGKTLKELVS